MSRKLIWLLLCIFGSTAYAAAETVVPTAAVHPVLDVNRLDAELPGPLDLDRIGREDVERDRQGLPPRYAIPEKVSITPANRGTWEDLGNGQMLWRLRILGGAGTTSLNLGFSFFKLGADERLLLYSADGSQILRPFTAADNEAHGQLWTPPVLTDDLIVELTVAKGNERKVGLELGWINQGYRGFGTTPAESYTKSGSCNLDVECLDPGDAWRQEVRAVGVISTGGSTFCSGSLLNNTANDRKMYFMTANHCSITSGNAASLVVFWNYQNSFCRTPGSGASGAAGDGPLTQFHTGSFFRAANSTSDFTLVELDDPPVPAYNHFWAGWDRSTGDFTCSAGAPCATIHHPNTDEKRITYVTTPMVTTSYFGTTSPGNGSHIWAHWATDPPGPFTVPGVTEPGSSGSPLYTQDRRFIGQLHGGLSECGATDDDLSDYYGRFSVSWTGGGTDSTRVSNWLDPGNTGATTLNGRENCTAPGAPVIGTASATGANQIQVTWSDGSPSSTTFNVYRAIGTCASPGPFGTVATSVAASPHNDNTVSGGTTYAYHVRGLDVTGACESVPSSCVQATATGSCTLPPTFAGLTSATNNGSASCGVTLAWSAATANCGGPITYNVYRSTSAGFTPGAGNRIATGVTGTSYVDTSAALVSGTIYYYIVRAVDGSNSVEDGNTVARNVTPTGPGTTQLNDTFEGALSGGGFDNAGWTHNFINGTVDWAWSTAQAQTPTHSWFSDSQAVVADRVLVTPSFVPQAGTRLSFWHTFDFEISASTGACFDAGTLEISTNGGVLWSVVPDAAFISGGFNGTVDDRFDNPLTGLRAWCGGTIGPMTQVIVDLTSFAGSTVQVRWHQGDDESFADTGWFVDSVNISSSSTCTSGPPPDSMSFYTLTPCRLVDTRNAAGPLGGPALVASSTRTFELRGTCSVPATAKALAVNFAVTNVTASGSLTAYPADQPAPESRVIYFKSGVTRANNGILNLDSTGAVKVGNDSTGTLNFIIDVVGYFE